mgnify:FL=1|uniref:DUF368 domain-containing protein n=1 Tax=Candidatus Ventrenecus sp. TaxID=3085654 RepID=UPI003FF05410
MNYLINGVRGFCMALADSVPGVSGGTIAFILGFYDQFINSLNNLVFGNKKEKKEALFFLIKLGTGWVIGMVLAILVLTSLFANHIYEVSSVFIGFIIFSLPLIISEEKGVLKGKYKNLLFLILGIVIVSLITYFNPMNGSENVVDITNLSFGLILYVFVAAMIAISAMVLPGISGSTLLLIFGLYIPITTAIKEFLHLNFGYFPILVVFGLGVLTGIAVVIKGIKVALSKYRSQTVYLILGLMLGSLYAIVMGPTTLEVYHEPMTFQTFSIGFFILGGLIIGLLQWLKGFLARKNK